ncbi:MAG: hypothetical protein GY760_01635 [Deltaproteobacteria bacterium]|nr:hypothetical protein [Deltaproteobacteria bacterium]
MNKTISQEVPLNQAQLKYLTRHLSDVNSKPLLQKRSFCKSIITFYQRPIVNGLMFIAGNLILCGLIGLIAVAVALNISLK